MTLLKALQGIEDLFAHPYLKQLKIMQREIESLDHIALLCAHKRLENSIGKLMADDAFAELSELAMRQWVIGNIGDNQLCTFVPPRLPRRVSEFLNGLRKYSHVESMAIMFALMEEVTLAEVTAMQWSDIKSMRLTKPGAQIVNTLPRQLKASWVFWEVDERGNQRPLLGLCRRFTDIEKISWQQYVSNSKILFDDMKPLPHPIKEFLNNIENGGSI